MVRHAFEAWRDGRGATADIFAPDIVDVVLKKNSSELPLKLRSRRRRCGLRGNRVSASLNIQVARGGRRGDVRCGSHRVDRSGRAQRGLVARDDSCWSAPPKPPVIGWCTGLLGDAGG